jgi:hypothetical protein
MVPGFCEYYGNSYVLSSVFVFRAIIDITILVGLFARIVSDNPTLSVNSTIQSLPCPSPAYLGQHSLSCMMAYLRHQGISHLLIVFSL